MSDTPTQLSSAKLQGTLSSCIKEGVWAQAMIIIIDYYMIPAALFLGASTKDIGFLVSVPHLLASLSQFAAVRSVRMAGSRRRFVLIGILVQAVFLLPIALLMIVPIEGRTAGFILLIVLYRIFSGLIGPVWGSLVSEYLPAEKRGQFFGTRSKYMGAMGIVSIVFWGLLLGYFKNQNLALGFAILFLSAALFRLLSFVNMKRMADMPLSPSQEADFNFWMFIRRFRDSNFVKFSFFVMGITFATHISAPFFSVYMLRDLQFSYITYMLIHLAALLSGLVSFSIWGRHADMVGNVKVIKLVSFFIPLIPLAWVFTRDSLVLFFIELVSGFIWGGFNLCSLNFIYDACVPEKRLRVISYFNFLNGFALFLGANLGAYLVDHLPPVSGFPLVTLFLISAALRFFAVLVLPRHFKEVRPVQTTTSSLNLLYSVVGIRPLLGQSADFNNFPPPSRKP